MAEHRDTRRRFEQWAHNPNCTANTISAVHGIPMADVAVADGVEPTMGQSPFAIARGQTFEKGLFYSEGKNLREELERTGVLPSGSKGIADLRMKRHGGSMRDLDHARAETSTLLQHIASGKKKPSIIASPTLLIPAGVMLPEALLVVDVVAVQYDGGKPKFIVGEIKTYPDRGGYTDKDELALARAQAGVYVHALRLVIDELKLTNQLEVSERGFLVLSRPGSNRPSVRANEDLTFQAARAKSGFALLEAEAQRLPAIDSGDADARMLAVRTAPTDYNERCMGFCDRVEVCRARALEAGDPAYLGENAARLLGKIDLKRAEALVTGSSPVTDAENELNKLLQGT